MQCCTSSQCDLSNRSFKRCITNQHKTSTIQKVSSTLTDAGQNSEWKKKKKKNFRSAFWMHCPHNKTADKGRNPSLNTLVPSELLPCILELSNEFPTVINMLPSQTWTHSPLVLFWRLTQNLSISMIFLMHQDCLQDCRFSAAVNLIK